MTQLVKVAKIGKSANSTDPNDFIFHSLYNTFKIIEEGSKSITLAASTANQIFSEPHNLSFLPLVTAFAKRDSASQVFLPNGVDVELYGANDGFSGDITFNYVSTDSNNVLFNFSNAKVTTAAVTIRYFLLEEI